MKISLLSLFGLTALILMPWTANGQTLSFELDGMAGPGITAANEPADVIDGGSGDIGPGGISVNLGSRVLSVDIEWGSANGYVDLSSDVDFMNLHGPTSAAAPGNFSESAGALTGLNGFDPSASSGGFVGTVKLSSANLRNLIEGRFYLHLHTFVNNGGEARGYLIPEVVIGDLNFDGVINLLDVTPFVQAVSGGPFVEEGDINRDGAVNLLDVGPFISLISG